jgi:hypothetical protein
LNLNNIKEDKIMQQNYSQRLEMQIPQENTYTGLTKTKNMDKVVLDIADEIKNGWSIYSFGIPRFESSYGLDPNFIVEVALTKEFKDGKNL